MDGAYVDDVKGLVDTLLSAEREPGINFCRNLARDDLEDFGAKLYEEIVEGGIDLLLNSLAVALAILNGLVDE